LKGNRSFNDLRRNIQTSGARLLLALPFLMIGNPAQADTAQDAAGCTAFYLANWDLEVAVYAPEDRDDTWKRQADGFAAVARRQGLSRDAIDRVIVVKRAAYLATIKGYVLRGDAPSRKIFTDRADICDTIVKTAPEMGRYR
tara:strand:+ start:333 stop:758 length:426 start_codon:yes stop_codon:yes gene_type:complete